MENLTRVNPIDDVDDMARQESPLRRRPSG